MNLTQDELDAVLADFDERREPFFEASINDAMRARAQAAETWEDEPSALVLAEAMAFGFAETGRSKESPWGTYYGPMLVLRGADGKDVESPSIDRVTAEMIDYWARRAGAAGHPRLRARYADLVWDLGKRVTDKRSDRFARLVIDATLDLVSGGHCEFETEAHAKLRRALDLAIAINDTGRIELVRDAMINFERTTAEDEKLGTWGIAFDALVENDRKTRLSDVQKNEIIADLEQRLARVAAAEPAMFHPMAAESAAIRLATYYRRKNQPEDVRRVLRVLTEVWVRMSGQADAILGATWLRKTHELLLQFGLGNDARALEERLRERERQSVTNMKPITHSVQIPSAEMDQYLESMTVGALHEVLTRVAGQFVPNIVEIKDDVLKLARDSPLMSIIPQSIMDHTGRVVARVGSVETDLDGHVVRAMSQRMTFVALFLRLVVQRTREKHDVSVEALLEFLYASPAFDASARPLLASGLRAYLGDDYAIAAHMLIPQIEAAVRRLAALLGCHLYKPGRHGGHHLRNLDELLRDKRLEEALTERVARYMLVLFTDQRGWNLRNDVCHGITPASAIGVVVADRLVHVLLLLGTLRAAEQAGEGESAPSAGP